MMRLQSAAASSRLCGGGAGGGRVLVFPKQVVLSSVTEKMNSGGLPVLKTVMVNGADAEMVGNTAKTIRAN